MTSTRILLQFLADDTGAVTVDWTVLSAGAVGMAIGTTAIMTDAIQVVSGRMDAELRARQLSDDWVQFYASHFSAALEGGVVSSAQAEALYDEANALMNYDIISHLADGIAAMEEGTLSEAELGELIAVASVAYQRNLADSGMLDYYFGFGGSDPYYVTSGLVPAG